jgi:hypothetical protein
MTVVRRRRQTRGEPRWRMLDDHATAYFLKAARYEAISAECGEACFAIDPPWPRGIWEIWEPVFLSQTLDDRERKGPVRAPFHPCVALRKLWGKYA